MSVRDQRDVPFAATGISGNTTQGLGDLYGRDQMLASCLRSVGPASNAGNAAPRGEPEHVARRIAARQRAHAANRNRRAPRAGTEMD